MSNQIPDETIEDETIPDGERIEGIPTRTEFDAEVAADVRTERRLLAYELIALALVVALLVVRQLWLL